MPTLTLKFKENIIKEYHLKKGDALTIGRKENNDVIIENLAVSGNHAKIDSVGNGFLLTDLQSKNGTFVNEQLVSSHYLKHEDIITVGKHTFVFAYAEGEPKPESDSVGDMDKTMVMDTNQHRAMMAKTSAKAKEAGSKGPATAVLSFLSGGEGDFELTKKLIKIGKDPSCDIIVDGFMVAKTAATISVRPNGYYLDYVGGMAKPKVNNKTTKEQVKLEEFDTIEIGSSKMQFILKN